MKIKELPREERPVEKGLIQGISVLSNPELIAILLGTGTREKSAIRIAEEIISADSRGIRYLAESLPEELMNISGVGEKKAARLMAAVELGKRISLTPRTKKINCDNSRDIAALFMEDMRYLKKEHLKILLLNVKLGIIGQVTISIGELSGAPVCPREVFNPAIRKSAAAICLIHNHPSGDPEPSEADIAVTHRIMESGEMLGIGLVDHIIIGDGVYTSLKERGFIF